MKKSKLSLGLVTSFIASMALTACGSDVTKNANNVVSFKGYDGGDLSIVTDEIYDDYMKSSTGIAKYYDQVMEVLIRNAFKKDPKGESTLKGIKKYYYQIENEAKDNVKSSKKTAKQNAETNGTSYKTEWQAILSEKGVKDEEELLQKNIYDLEKEEIEDWYYEQHKDDLKKEYLGINKDGTEVASKASSRFPYHVRHILIKVEDGASDYTRGTITEAQAKLLSSTVELLAQGVMTFGEVAQKKSEDSSSSSYGDVGIMNNAISGGKLGMVNEFQLGIYAYDAIKKNASTSEVIDGALGVSGPSSKLVGAPTVKNYFTTRGIAEIPYSVLTELGQVADVENSKADGLPVLDGKAALYPRNLLWNRYFNNHSIFVITNGKQDDAATLAGLNDILDPTISSEYTDNGLAGFKEAEGFTGTGRTNEKVLCDEKGNVIIGVRSQYGIHLMIVEKSAYDFADKVSLEDYYTTAIPGDSDYPKYTEADADEQHPVGSEKVTYVNFINSVNKSEYNTRADAVKSAIKGFDSTYDYRLYEALTANREQDFSGEKTMELLGLIDNYINIQRDKNVNDQATGIEEVWQTYVELLQAQDTYRQTLKRALPEGCKIAFNESSATWKARDEFKEGGKCYVK